MYDRDLHLKGLQRTAATVLSANFAPGTGAGEGNRTLVCSLGSCRSAIELRPRTYLMKSGTSHTFWPDIRLASLRHRDVGCPSSSDLYIGCDAPRKPQNPITPGGVTHRG